MGDPWFGCTFASVPEATGFWTARRSITLAVVSSILGVLASVLYAVESSHGSWATPAGDGLWLASFLVLSVRRPVVLVAMAVAGVWHVAIAVHESLPLVLLLGALSALVAGCAMVQRRREAGNWRRALFKPVISVRHVEPAVWNGYRVLIASMVFATLAVTGWYVILLYAVVFRALYLDLRDWRPGLLVIGAFEVQAVVGQALIHDWFSVGLAVVALAFLVRFATNDFVELAPAVTRSP